MANTPLQSQEEDAAPGPVPLAEIHAAVSAIRFGEVRIVIQDGQVVQIEKVEKLRLQSPRTRGRGER